MQIRSQEAFPIVYLLSDPNDSGTYYVRSVLRNSATGATIQVNGANFVNLTVDSNNSRRFSKLIQAPNDPSGLGFFVDITTTVYTDAAYTTKSDVYREQLDTHLIAERWNPSLGGGSGMTSISIDYDKLRAVIAAELATLDLESPDLSAVLLGHEKTQELIRGIEMPENSKIDLTPHTTAIIDTVLKALKDLPKFEKTDLSPVLERIGEIEIPEKLTPEEVSQIVAPHIEAVNSALAEIQKLLPEVKYRSFLKDLSVAARSIPAEEPEKPKSRNRARSLL